MAKPVRAVRRTEKPKEDAPRRPGWKDQIEGNLEIDPVECQARVEKFLASKAGQLSASEIEKLLDDAAEVGALADKLSARARRDYELAKEEHAVWMEARKSAARTLLEEEKAAGNLTKKVTIDMVDDAVRANWPEDYAQRNKRLKDFQAAVHVLEMLPHRCQDRRNSVAKLADMTMARGTPTRGGR